MKKYFGQWWYINLLLIGILLFYSILATTFIFIIIQQNPLGTHPTDSAQKQNFKEYVVGIFIISENPDRPLNRSLATFAVLNATLYTVLKKTLGDNISGKFYGDLGFYITGFYGVMEGDNYYWLYYYYDFSQGTWISAPVGVSNFIITSHSVFRFVLTKVG